MAYWEPIRELGEEPLVQPGSRLRDVTNDIASATQARDSYVREAQGKESRLFALLDGMAVLWKDVGLIQLLEAEGLSKQPELAGTYNVVPRQ